MNLIARIFGQKKEITFHFPTNEEYNAYSNEISDAVKKESDEQLYAARAKYFDLWVEKIAGMDKAAIPDVIKSSIMFQTFEKIEVEEKN